MKVERLIVGLLEENCYILSIDDNVLIVDPGSESNRIKDIVKDKRVLGILVTHYHHDHVGALQEIKEFYDVPVIDYKSERIQKLGPFSFDLIETKGHKEDCVTFYFKGEQIMFVGDFIFKGSIGRCDLEGGNENSMQKSLNKISKYNRDISLYPGHGDKTSLGNELDNNPFMKGITYE